MIMLVQITRSLKEAHKHISDAVLFIAIGFIFQIIDRNKWSFFREYGIKLPQQGQNGKSLKSNPYVPFLYSLSCFLLGGREQPFGQAYSFSLCPPHVSRSQYFPRLGFVMIRLSPSKGATFPQTIPLSYSQTCKTRYNAFSKTENDVFNEIDFARLLYLKA